MPGAEFLRQGLHAILAWLAAHPKIPFGLFGGLYLLGAMASVGKKTFKVLLGAGIVLAGLTWFWKNRRDAAGAIGALIVALVVGGWLLALYLSPELRWNLFVPLCPVVLAAAFWPAGWPFAWVPGGFVDQYVGEGRTIREALSDWAEAHAVHQKIADRMGDEAWVGRPRRSGDGWEADYARPKDAEAVDPDEIGGAVNEVTDVRNVEVRRGDKLGHGTLVLSPHPPEPELTPWQRFEQMGTLVWPGPGGWSDRDPMSPASPLRVFYDQWGRPADLPVPGTNGGSTLLCGVTRSGKSGTLHVITADLAFRHDTAIIYLDPQGVEGALWADRCTAVAVGVRECERMIAHLPRIMERRLAHMGGIKWRTSDGAQLLVICDEYALIPRKAKDGMSEWLAGSAKAGCGTLLALQRAQREMIPLDQRDNFHVGVALHVGSDEANGMILGHGEGVPNAREIPLGLKGAAWLRYPSGNFLPVRSYYLCPPYPVPAGDEPIQHAVVDIARATAGLRVSPKEAGL